MSLHNLCKQSKCPKNDGSISKGCRESSCVKNNFSIKINNDRNKNAIHWLKQESMSPYWYKVFKEVSREGKVSPYRRKTADSYKGNDGDTNLQLDKEHSAGWFTQESSMDV